MLPGMPSLAYRLVPDVLWQLVGHLLAPPLPHEHGGAPRRLPDRACFAAVVLMLRTSTPWELLPAKGLGCGAGRRRTGVQSSGDCPVLPADRGTLRRGTRRPIKKATSS